MGQIAGEANARCAQGGSGCTFCARANAAATGSEQAHDHCHRGMRDACKEGSDACKEGCSTCEEGGSTCEEGGSTGEEGSSTCEEGSSTGKEGCSTREEGSSQEGVRKRRGTCISVGEDSAEPSSSLAISDGQQALMPVWARSKNPAIAGFFCWVQENLIACRRERNVA